MFTEEGGQFEGMFYDKANKAVTDLLTEKDALLKLNFITHSYPHDWRTKKPVIFRATPQWFASINKVRQDILDAIEETDFKVDWGKTRIYNTIRIVENGLFLVNVYGEFHYLYSMPRMAISL